MARDDRGTPRRRRQSTSRELSYRSRRATASPVGTAGSPRGDVIAADTDQIGDVEGGPSMPGDGLGNSSSNWTVDGSVTVGDVESWGSVWSQFDRSFRVLSIDGGGARGMIPAVILEEVERRSGRRISDLFHRICGTSTGAILACGLAAPEEAGSTTPRFRARDIVEIYRSLGEQIFDRGSFNDTVVEPMAEVIGLLDHDWTWYPTHLDQTVDGLRTACEVWERLNAPLHDINKLAYVLWEHLGDLRLKDALTELFVYAYDIGSRTPEVLGSVGSSIPATRAYPNVRMYQAATASSAAAPFFGPYRLWRQADDPVEQTTMLGIPLPTPIYPAPTGSGDDFDLVDGGNAGLGNPALFALHEDTELSAGQDRFVLSIGTGHHSEPITTDARGWGFLQWLGEGGELLKCTFDGEADVADMVMRKLDATEGSGVTYYRWQAPIPESLAFLDEGSVADMNALEDVARTFIADNDEEIDEVVELLTRPSLVLQSA
jgi:patatin-like phospholipase/acyl hydrolase